MTNARHEIPPGTLDMLILGTLARSDPLHGFEIAEAIQRASSDGSMESRATTRSLPLAAEQGRDGTHHTSPARKFFNAMLRCTIGKLRWLKC